MQIIMEYSEVGTLEEVIRLTKRTLTEDQIAIVCRAMLSTLVYPEPYFVNMGRVGISSNIGLRLSNIVLTTRGEVKFSKSLELTQTKWWTNLTITLTVVTEGQMDNDMTVILNTFNSRNVSEQTLLTAPEIIRGKSFNFKVTLFILLVSQSPYPVLLELRQRTYKSAVWSLGILIVILAEGRIPHREFGIMRVS